MNWIYAILLLLVVSSCCNKPVQTRLIVKDSVIVREMVTVDSVRVPGETITLTEWIECDSVTNKPKPKQTTYSQKVVKVDELGTLTVSCDSLLQINKELRSKIERISSRDEVIELIKYKTRKVHIYAMWLAGVLLAWQAFKILILKRL